MAVPQRGVGGVVDETMTHSPHGNYLDRLMRRQSFQALWPLFALADKPAKELTESFSALVHLRDHLPRVGPCRVIHVGDGAHARTAALFALKTKADNISVDPEINERRVADWRDRFGIERFSWHRGRIETLTDTLDALPRMPTLVTFVHAHVHVDTVLDSLRYNAAFTLACCSPASQLTSRHRIAEEGEDPGVLSSHRRFQVLLAG